MPYRGVIKDNSIQMKDPLPYLNGTEVIVTIEAVVPKRHSISMRTVLEMVGVPAGEEMERIFESVQMLRRNTNSSNRQRINGTMNVTER